jgi:hypothetical protein
MVAPAGYFANDETRACLHLAEARRRKQRGPKTADYAAREQQHQQLTHECAVFVVLEARWLTM